MSVPPPPWAPERKLARPRLSVDAIVAAGLELLAADGIDAVTMRAVASKVGTGAASLYAHVRDKGELHVLMLDRVIGEIECPAADPERWREQIKDLCRSQHAALVRHPGIAMVSMAHVATGPNALRYAEGMLAILVAGGLSAATAGLAIDLLSLYPTAVAFERSIWNQRPELADRSVDWVETAAQLRSYFASLPTDRFPLLASMAAAVTGGGGDTRFEFGLDVLVAGLEALKDWEPPAELSTARS